MLPYDSLIVTMTGFTTDPMESQYKTMLSDLNIRTAAKLSEQTRVLIVKSVNTEKYKVNTCLFRSQKPTDSPSFASRLSG